jgi:hypothetical protein
LLSNRKFVIDRFHFREVFIKEGKIRKRKKRNIKHILSYAELQKGSGMQAMLADILVEIPTTTKTASSVLS